MYKRRTQPKDFPELGSRAEWSRLLDVSGMTLDRAEKRGDLKGSIYLNSRVKLYPKAEILAWLKLGPPVESTPAPVKKGIVRRRVLSTRH
jgi:hypothetical protein